MNTLLNTIKSLQLQARKDRHTIATNLLTTLLGELNTMVVNTRQQLTNDEIIEVVQKFVKNNNITIKSLESNGVEFNSKDTESLNKLKEENTILTSLLPTQLTETELRALICKELFQEIEPPSMQDIMKFLIKNYAGRYDGKLASTIAKNLIESSNN